MAEEKCNHDCSSCSSKCENEKQSFIEKPNELSNIKKVIGIVSGKGGVGKSLVTSLLASNMNKQGYNVGILDADITGPSIPKAFGINSEIQGGDLGAFPAKSKNDVEVMSLNLLLDDETTPVVWRGPVIAGAVKQFWTDIIWADVDYLFIDMPPGTGDVPLTVFQSIPLDGIIIVTSPQELVGMIVEKAVKMANMMDIPVLGIVENMSYFECKDCGKIHYIYGESKVEELAKSYKIDTVYKIPIDSTIAELCDKGMIEDYDKVDMNNVCEKLKTLMNK